MDELTHFIGGRQLKGASGRFVEGLPMTGRAIWRIPLASKEEVRAAVVNASAAQPAWAATNPQRRARLDEFLDLVARDMGTPAELLAQEHGTTIPNANGDIRRGVEAAEFALGIRRFMPPGELC
jgi:malonate-semialdehyde dehydrogenase (acetylating)/methylmalonate-semialdehyde dehydrogenase